MCQRNDGDVDGDDGQLMASCLEEGCPLGVETAGSPNICLANPSNLVIVMLMLMLIPMLVILMIKLLPSSANRTYLPNSPPQL